MLGPFNPSVLGWAPLLAVYITVAGTPVTRNRVPIRGFAESVVLTGWDNKKGRRTGPTASIHHS